MDRRSARQQATCHREDRGFLEDLLRTIIAQKLPPPAYERKDFDDEETWLDWLDALSIQRRSEIVGFTGWTFEQLDDQPRPEIDRLLLYLGKKRAIEKEAEAFDT